MCSEEQCTHNGAEKSVYKKNSKLFGFTEQSTLSAVVIGPPTGEHAGNNKYSLYSFKDCGHVQNIDRHLFKNGKYKCRECEDLNLKSEAIIAGLTLLERASKGVQPLYKFNACQHTQRIGYTAVRRSQFKCRTCKYGNESLDEIYTREASSHGLSYVGREKNIGVYLCQQNHTFRYQISAVRNSKPNCPECFDTRIRQDAEKVGLVFIGNASKSDKRNYLKKCGHSQEYTPAEVSNMSTSPTCYSCRKEELSDIARSLGIEPQDTVIKSSTLFKLSCGHLKKVDILNARVSLNCKTCYEQNIICIAKDYGYIDISLSKKGPHFRSFKSKKCGHQRDIQVHDLLTRKRAKMVCVECISSKHTQEAALQGLVIEGVAENGDPNYRSYSLPCCGKLKDIEVTHVRKGTWTCCSCNITYASLPSNIYLLEITLNSHKWLKVGFARNVDHRVKTYNLQEGAIVEKLYIVPFKVGKSAITFEKQLHKKFKSYRLTPKNMRVFQESGFTECYPISMKDTLLEELRRLNDN
jgi:hypothetical protein